VLICMEWEHCQLWAGAVLATAQGTSGVGSAGRANTATAAVPEALVPGVYSRAGGAGVRKATIWQGLAWGQHTMPQLRKGAREPIDPENMT